MYITIIFIVLKSSLNSNFDNYQPAGSYASSSHTHDDKQSKEWIYHGQATNPDGSGIGGQIINYNEILICYGYDRQTQETKLLPVKMIIGQDGLGIGSIVLHDSINNQSCILNYYNGYLCLSSNSNTSWHVSIWGR